jgi:hypothetical protein
MSRVLKINQGDYTVQVSDTGSLIFDANNIIATGNVDIAKNLNITGDIHVTGVPYGTAPIVGHVLHVTTDGKDTNDGSAQDAARACRTIGGALNSPLYQPGTSIKVAAGHYLEHNPLVMKPYTSIIGSDLRTTAIEPINKTQDLFHVASSCYIAQMQFINGRSGIVDPYIDRGAYAVSFPLVPYSGKKLDVYKSPYVQNCTNQSGPWLYDGAMFVPNQTVQVPLVVGIAEPFVEGESIIRVRISEGNVTPAFMETMSINTAPQEQGFFAARTLMLANMEFIQLSTLQSINAADPTFVYSSEKCSRDISIIVNAILYDATFGGNSKSVEAGTAYWNGVVSVIASELTQTDAALLHIIGLLSPILTNTTSTSAFPDTITYKNKTVVRHSNPNLTNGIIAIAPLTHCINIIRGITKYGLNDINHAVPPIFYTTGPEFGLVSAEELIQRNRAFIQEEVIAYIDSKYSAYSYDVKTCERDVGLIIDALRYDMLFGSNYQSIIAGRAYLRSAAGSVLSSEKTVTIDAFIYLLSLLDTLADRNLEAKNSINNNMNIIIDIIRTGITAIPSTLIINPPLAQFSTSYINVRHLIDVNRDFITAEVIEYLRVHHNATSADLYQTINRTTCRRDVGYVLDAIYYDLTYGGNTQSIITGEAYYSYTTMEIAETELTAILAVFELISDIIYQIGQGFIYTPLQTVINQVLATVGTGTAIPTIAACKLVNDIRTIIKNANQPAKILPTTTWVNSGLLEINALIEASIPKLQNKITRYIGVEHSQFSYDKTLCMRDIGLIIDAIAYDTILGGNSKTVEAGLGYYAGSTRVVCDDEVPKIKDALTKIKEMLVVIINNDTVTRIKPSGNKTIQSYDANLTGGVSTAQPTIERNIDIISNIISNGPYSAPRLYTGTALFAATGVSLDDVKQATKVISWVKITDPLDNLYEIELSTPTVGMGTRSTLYFGYTSNYPTVESLISERWSNRKLDPWGAMGGMLIDGAVVSDVSPVRSFVADAFTQVNQGGRGVRVTNNGYVQLVSVFTIFSSIAVQADNGGIASVTNSNSNFGKYCMISKGYGVREFSGTIYNPPILPLYPAGFYPSNATVEVFVPDIANRPHVALIMEVEPPLNYKNAYGLPGFISAAINFPTILAGTLALTDVDVTDMYIGQTVFMRDLYGRYSDPVTNLPYLVDGTTISDMDPSTIYLSSPVNVTAGASVRAETSIGNLAYSTVTLTDGTFTSGLQPSMLVVGQGIAANTAIESILTTTTFKITIAAGVQVDNVTMRFYTAIPNYFTFFTTGNAYYQVLSSIIKDNPSSRSDGTTIDAYNNKLVLSSGADNPVPPAGQQQVPIEKAALVVLKTILKEVAANTLVGTQQSLIVQKRDSIVYTQGGSTAVAGAQTRIDALVNIITNCLVGVDFTSADAIKFKSIRVYIGSTNTPVEIDKGNIANVNVSCSDAAALIGMNIEFFVEEITAWLNTNHADLVYNATKCRRDVRLICRNIVLDLLNGGNYNAIYSGLSYYSRNGTYHVVDLENQVRDNALFPDGAFVNFYQRSYITASGYLFEYVGAGTNYGALPQVGRADPQQANEVNMLTGGKVFFTSTDQSGDFRIGTGLVISQANGSLRGRTFQKSLFSEMTPFILALER